MSQDKPPSRSVGESLRLAREQRGLSLTDCAQRLHILASYLGAMEEGRYSALPGTVFLRGYVRSYGRLLGLDEEHLVAQLDRELRADEPEAGDAAAQAPVVEKRRVPLGWLVPVAVVLILGAALAIWRFGPFQDGVGSDSAGEQGGARNAPESIFGGSESAGKAPLELTGEGTDPAWAQEDTRGAMTDSATSADDQQEPSFTSDQYGTRNQDFAPERDGTQDQNAITEDAIAEERNLNEPGPVEDQIQPLAREPEVSRGTQASGSDSGTASERAAGSPAVAVAEPATDRPLAAALDRVEVRFSGDCWFELRDADGKRRIGLFRAGDRLSYEGRAPFRIVVGAVSATEMEFNGTPVDFSQYPVRNNRIGLTLGQ